MLKYTSFIWPGHPGRHETKQSNGRESLSDVPSYTYQDWPLLQDSFFESAKSHVHLQVQRLKMERSVLLPTNTFRDSKQCIKGGIGGLMGEEPHQLMAYFIRPPQKRLAFCYTGTLASSLQLYSKHRHLFFCAGGRKAYITTLINPEGGRENILS